MSIVRRRIVTLAVVAGVSAIASPWMALAADPEAELSSVRSSIAGVSAGSDLGGVVGGGGGQHIVCYAPGFAEYTICVDYPG